MQMPRLPFSALAPQDNLLKGIAKPGVHEADLEKFFRGKMQFSESTPEFDRPLLIMAFTNRSGSNLACDYARQCNRIGGAGEYLNRDIVKNASENLDSFPDYIRHLDATLAPKGEVLALKASWDQLAMLLRNGIPGMYRETFVLHCLRNDTLAQAVSYAIALRSGKWESRQQGGTVDASDIPLKDIERHMTKFHRANLLIRLLCDAHGLRRWEIGYERLCVDNGAHLGLVLRTIKIAPPGWVPGKPVLERQSGTLNQTLVENYLSCIRAVTSLRSGT